MDDILSRELMSTVEVFFKNNQNFEETDKFTIIKRRSKTESIVTAIKENNGYCPCKAVKDETTKCMCEEFRNQVSGECNCGLFEKFQAKYVLYTKEGCPRCDILTEELDKNGVLYKKFTEYPEHIVNLPVLVSAMGIEYDFKKAMGLFRRNRTI